MWITDPVTGQKSVTLTFFSIGFIVALAKLILAGIDIGIIKMQTFSGGDFAAVAGALGGIYALRRMSDKNDTGSN